MKCWHDYPGEWFEQDVSGPEEARRRVDAFEALLGSDVALLLVDGQRLVENSGREQGYLKSLLSNFRNGLLSLKGDLLRIAPCRVARTNSMSGASAVSRASRSTSGPAIFKARTREERTLRTWSASDEQPRGRFSGVLEAGGVVTSRNLRAPGWEPLCPPSSRDRWLRLVTALGRRNGACTCLAKWRLA